ncbi:MAG: 4-(cytidine 5'-diphospho)-2-C-methyl-D-erythritol kinase [Parabacteroides sp.]|nr:4-(cytidine 5'-diphospho)-2-C-methyl-D-erythritol kinase [Parabacteroides sp.]
MICFPNAKINLGLRIVGKRSDGYHDIETVFYPVPLKEALEIVPASRLTFTQTGIPVDAPAEKNLVMKAYRLLEKQYSLPPVAIHLLKAIPSGAGLGGGSADAAFMLKLLNDFCSLHIPAHELEKLASALGADCAFFIRNTPVFATGTGNIFAPADVSLKKYYLCVVKPDIFVSTPEAYSLVKPAVPDTSLKEIIGSPVEEWKGRLVNDFEESVFARHPAIGKIKDTLYQAGAVYASMSGSGSSVFGLFGQPVRLNERFPGCYVWEGWLE